jgi:phospholipase C
MRKAQLQPNRHAGVDRASTPLNARPVASASVREAGSLPRPDEPVGAVDEQMPFDHIVVVMMENHSFDNLLGALSRTHPSADGLSFDSAGEAINSNPWAGGTPSEVRAFALPNTAQATNVTQSWKATHEQIDGGAMDGFVGSAGAQEPMGYYTPEVLPFAYSLASTFTLGNRWFSSVPGPTYPNRRFLLAGTAWGGTVTDVKALFDAPPPHGTIFDRLSDHHVGWASYFTDVPATAVIPSIVVKHLLHHHPIDRFFHDCQAGSLPAVSFVDPAMGLLSSLASRFSGLPTLVKDAIELLGPPAETEEDPDDMYYGEAWAHRVVDAVLRSPAWSRTLLVYIYDEHGGYYDHVPPPAAIPPDDIEPRLQPGDPQGGYDMYGPRVPAVVVSPYSRPGGVSNVVCDHTSVLATIEAKWNLPALTRRDANANTVMDFLDLSNAALLTPPSIDGPSDTGPSGPVDKSA